jgi:hypothetical protein
MRIRVLSSMIVAGVHAEAGEVVEADKATADMLCRMGRAEYADEPQDARLVESAAVEPPETAMQPRASRRRG